MNKDVVYKYNGLLPRHKKERNLSICDNVDGCIEGYYARWNKSDRKTNALLFHLHVGSKPQKRKETNEKPETDS